MKAKVTVRLKPSVLDPQGKVIQGSLGAQGFAGLASVRQGKIFDVELNAKNREDAESQLKAMCEKLLANPLMETFEIEVLA